ncbi:hypothetical protein APHAL10511_004479 [Amanita phalloides]|nr:hypothetical protein APHAL10511_004479 [Amanita phalloides]
MATPQALSFPEIINLICEKCEPSTLAALARVGRDFTEPVLNALWRSIPDLRPLIRCMPQDLWEEEAIEFEEPRLTFCRSILPSDWDRFKIHAVRVRKLGFSELPHYDLGLNVYGVLACASVGRLPLLPRLTHIRWLGTADDEFPYINLFLSPFIIHLEFDITPHSDKRSSVGLQLSLLPSLVSTCPNMEHLTLNGYGTPWELELSLSLAMPWPQEIKSAFSIMEQWSSLHHLELEGVLDSSIPCIAKLPALRTLVITAARETTEILAAHIKGFPVLESLSISGDSTIELCIIILKFMSQVPLHSLQMEIWDVAQAVPGPELFEAICQGIAHNSLWDIHINCPNSGYHIVQPDEGDLSITLGDLSPLLAFTRLSELSIELFGQFKLDNKDLQTMTSAWPHLRTLKLISLNPSEHWPQATIKGLISVVQLCPLLENLALEFDATVVPDIMEKPVRCGARNERICALNILCSPIDNPAKVATFLSDIFPNLRSINLFRDVMGHSWDGFDDLELTRQKWKETESLTALFSSVRMQEKLHYTSST